MYLSITNHYKTQGAQTSVIKDKALYEIIGSIINSNKLD